jgi:hypothetical protein
MVDYLYSPKNHRLIKDLHVYNSYLLYALDIMEKTGHIDNTDNSFV